MPRFPLTLPALLLLGLGAAGCDRVPGDSAPRDAGVPDTGPVPASVMGVLVALNASWGDAYTRGDAPGMASFYTGDAVLMAPEGDVAGREAIREFFAARFAARTDTVLGIATHTTEIDMAGDRAWEAGSITWTLAPRGRPDEARTIAGRYVTFWQQEADGVWRVRRSFRTLP
jgi:uncharacterized protein (TIGR02246 family)